MNRLKNVQSLCDAVKRVTTNYPQVRLSVFGVPVSDEEMLAEEVAERVKSYESSKEINFLGSVSEAEMSLFVAQGDLIALVSTYKSECQPLSVITAMALNKKLLLADTAAMRATVGSYENVTYTTRRTEDIANSLERILLSEEENKRSQTEINPIVLNRFSPDKFFRTMSEAINDW